MPHLMTSSWHIFVLSKWFQFEWRWWDLLIIVAVYLFTLLDFSVWPSAGSMVFIHNLKLHASVIVYTHLHLLRQYFLLWRDFLIDSFWSLKRLMFYGAHVTNARPLQLYYQQNLCIKLMARLAHIWKLAKLKLKYTNDTAETRSVTHSSIACVICSVLEMLLWWYNFGIP